MLLFFFFFFNLLMVGASKGDRDVDTELLFNIQIVFKRIQMQTDLTDLTNFTTPDAQSVVYNKSRT